MGKLFETVLGFVFLVLPVAVIVGLGFVWSWDFSRIYTGLPHDPFALGGTVFAGVYAVVVTWVISKALRIAKANKKDS